MTPFDQFTNTKSGRRKAARFLVQWDEAQRAARICLGLPKAYEGPVLLRVPSNNAHLNDSMRHYWTEGDLAWSVTDPPLMVRTCDTVLPHNFESPLDVSTGIPALPRLNLPCPCGRVIWRVETFRRIRPRPDHPFNLHADNIRLANNLFINSFVNIKT
jgi:hypothetical protein